MEITGLTVHSFTSVSVKKTVKAHLTHQEVIRQLTVRQVDFAVSEFTSSLGELTVAVSDLTSPLVS